VAQIGIAVTKSVSFRGVQQEFSNQYNYEHLTGAGLNAEQLLDELVAVEKPFHSTDVTFVRGKVWTSGGSPGENEMLIQKDLSGTGTQGTNTSMDRERAILIRWPAGVDSRGHPVYLRKWYHSCGNFAGNSFSAGILQNTLEINATIRSNIAASAEAVRELGATEVWGLCSPTGRATTGQAQCHAWLEHHQLGDMWR
jgi:hypothetical protein